MSIITIFLISVGLAMDAFAVAIASSIALRTVSPRQVFRLAFHLGLFQAMMPVIGWLAGRGLFQYIAGWDHWVAFGLLGYVGSKAIYESFSRNEEAPREDPTRGMNLVVLSIATSIDALAVGLSFAMLSVDIWYPSVIIGIVTAALTAFGMIMGSAIGVRFGKRIEIVGGLVLIGIGIKILLQHI